MAGTDFTVRINSKDGALEISGPEREWVDSKLEQLKPVFEDYRAGTEDGDEEPPPPKPKSRRKKSAKPAADSGGKGAPKRARATGGRAVINEELRDRLTPEVRGKFSDFLAPRRKSWDKSQTAQAAIIAMFLADELGIDGVDPNDLYTAYSVMGERSPRNLRAVLTNAQHRSRYFGGSANGKTTLSHAGENYARFDSLDSGDGD